MEIHTGSPVNETFYVVDADGNGVAIPTGIFQSDVKGSPNDAAPLLRFKTGGGVGLGTITRTTAVIDGVTYDVLVFTAAKELTTGLRPGSATADLILLDGDQGWQFDFSVLIIKGITGRT